MTHNTIIDSVFWNWQLVVAIFTNAIIQAIQVGAYAARWAGVRTGRIATSISLFNLFVTASRLAALFYSTMLGPLSDKAGNAIRIIASSKLTHPAVIVTHITAIQHLFENQLRVILLAGTIGTVIGSLLLPMFTYLYVRGIRSFEKTKSIPHSLMKLAKPQVLWEVITHNRLPTLAELRSFSLDGIPRRILIFNVVVTSVYAVGVVAAYYASVLDIHLARTAIGMSGIVNGIGTIAFTFFVDPQSSIIVDEAVKGERPKKQVRAMVFYLSASAITGWVLSQLILWPSAEFIRLVAHAVYRG